MSDNRKPGKTFTKSENDKFNKDYNIFPHPSVENISLVKPLSSRELIEKEIPAKKLLLSPWLKENETAMIYAPPGTGKTFFALNCAYSLASGKRFLKFIPCENLVKVLYVDAEMDGRELQDRWNMVIKGNINIPVDFITPMQFHDFYVPQISTPEGQAYYSKLIDENDYKVIIFDNLSNLNHLDENKAESWNLIQRWFVQLKNKGKSIIIIHHTNKSKSESRGTSKISDNLNSVIFLEENKDESRTQTASFKVKFKKNRSFHGEDAEDFDAWLTDKGTWEMTNSQVSNRAKVIELYKMGMSATEIAKDLIISLRTVYRYIDDADSLNELKKRPYKR